MKYSKAEMKWRQRYAKVSYRLRQQYKQLKQKYPESVAFEHYGPNDFESLKDLGPDYSMDLIKKRTKMFEGMVKSGTLSLQRHRRAYSLARESLAEKGVKVSKKDLGGYFRFLDDLKARGIAGMKGSGEWADIYNRIKKFDLSKEQIERNIDAWSRVFERNENYTPRLRKNPVSSKKMRK